MKSIATTAVVVFFASWMSNGIAEPNQSQSSSGTIQFSGSIVESLCAQDIRPHQVEFSCERNGQTSVSTLSLNNTALQPLPKNIGSSQVKWLDQQHKLGIVTVTYR